MRYGYRKLAEIVRHKFLRNPLNGDVYILPALKAMAMQKGSNLNIDETWCRYKSYYGGIRKKYMWCLVNAKARIAIFFYGEDGGRSRNVLKDFLLDAKELKSIQSDGYNAYMYLDDELVDIEHLCCLAHARAKFWYAYEQGCDLARFSTCRQVGVSFRDYFRKLMKELGTGRTDYENLLPMTIGL